MIDKNGKLFGKINIIDLVVIVVLAAAVAVFAFAKLSGRGEGAAPETFTMEFYADEVPDYATEHLKEGEPIYEADKHIYMGKITSFEVGPSKSYNPNSDGVVVVSEKEGFKSVKITGEMTGTLENFGAVIDGEKFGVGHTFTSRMGKAKIYIRVSDIK